MYNFAPNTRGTLEPSLIKLRTGRNVEKVVKSLRKKQVRFLDRPMIRYFDSDIERENNTKDNGRHNEPLEKCYERNILDASSTCNINSKKGISSTDTVCGESSKMLWAHHIRC